MRRGSFPLVLALVTANATQAYAQAEDEAASTELFNAGRDSMRRGDYAAACPKLADSARLKATVGALAKLAECEEHEQRRVSAYTRWKQALNLALSTGDERAADVEREVLRLDRIVGKIRVVAAAPLPPETSLRVDDLTLSAAGVGIALPVEPGRHTVQATAPHRKPWSVDVVSNEDGATTTVTVPPLEPADEPSPPPPSPSAPPPSTPPPPARPPVSVPLPHAAAWRTVGLTTGAVGLAALATGGVFGVVAMNRRDDAHCAGTVCPDGASASKLESAKSSADWSTGLLVAGGALAAAGAAIWLLAHDPRAPARVGAVLLPGGAGVAGWWR